MALTVQVLTSDNVDVAEVYVDRTDEGYFVLKQYDQRSRGDPGDRVVLTPAMLDALVEWKRPLPLGEAE